MTITLDRYQELMTLPVNAFNGLNKPDEQPRYACATIWKQSDRMNLLRFLTQAEFMREQELGYYLSPTQIDDEMFMKTNNPHILSKKHLRGLGKVVSEDISISTALSHETIYDEIIDPVVVTVATTVTNADEVHVYKYSDDGLKHEVLPTFKSISSGTLTMKIPRARLVDPDLLDDRDDHLMYEDTSNFVTTVDIVREYLDPSQAVVYYWTECNTFAESTQTGYGVIRDNRLSIVEAYPAVWSGGSAAPVRFSTVNVHGVRISYQSGLMVDVPQDIMTIRLAHSLMPYEPCTCEPVHQYWQADVERDPSDVNTPYGASVAAVAAWIADSRAKVGFSTTTGGIRR